MSFEHSNYYEPKNSDDWLITKCVMKLPIPIPNYPNYPHGEGLTPLSHVNCRFGIRGWGRVLGTHMHINCNPAITISQDLHYFFRKLHYLGNVFQNVFSLCLSFFLYCCLFVLVHLYLSLLDVVLVSSKAWLVHSEDNGLGLNGVEWVVFWEHFWC